MSYYDFEIERKDRTPATRHSVSLNSPLVKSSIPSSMKVLSARKNDGMNRKIPIRKNAGVFPNPLSRAKGREMKNVPTSANNIPNRLKNPRGMDMPIKNRTQPMIICNSLNMSLLYSSFYSWIFLVIISQFLGFRRPSNSSTVFPSMIISRTLRNSPWDTMMISL